MDEMLDESKYQNCWCCGSLTLNARVEMHHMFGKAMSNETIPLCIICHDFVDRMPLKDIEVFSEMFANVMKELKEIKQGELRYIKLYMLKMAKIAYQEQRLGRLVDE